MEVVLENKEVILLFLLSLSEILGLNPKVKSNSIFQLVVNALKKLKEAFPPKA